MFATPGETAFFGTVELAQPDIAEEYAVHVFIHLLEPYVFIAEDFADKHPTFMPADIAALVAGERKWISLLGIGAVQGC
jgi:hypothetical protein